MRWIVPFVLLMACGSPGGSDAGSDAPDLQRGFCCPPDPKPGCCMRPGGWSETGSCPWVCDGMPYPDDPGWKLAVGAHGCMVWSNPRDACDPTVDHPWCCGAPGPVDMAHP